MIEVYGRTIALKGRFATVSQSEAKAALKGLGAKVTGTISGKSDLMIAGGGAEDEVRRAGIYNVPVVGERELMKLLEMDAQLAPAGLEGPLADYVERFEAMVQGLRVHPNVHVVNFQLGPPAGEKDIAFVESHLGAGLDPAIANFYRQANGLSLLWIRRDSDRFHARRHGRRFGQLSWQQVADTEGTCDGSVCILPIREAFAEESWEGHPVLDTMSEEASVELAGEEVGGLELRRGLRIFDYFDALNMMALLAREGRGDDLPVVMGGDRGANWTDSRVTDFATYMEGVLASCGLVRHRREVYGEKLGHRQAPLRRDLAGWRGQGLSLDDVAGPSPSGAGVARRSRFINIDGDFLAEDGEWRRQGEGLGEALGIDKGKGVSDLALGPDGEVSVVTEAGVYAVDRGGAVERRMRWRNKGWSSSVCVDDEGGVWAGGGSRLMRRTPDGKVRKITPSESVCPPGGITSLASHPDDGLVVGFVHGVALLDAEEQWKAIARRVDGAVGDGVSGWGLMVASDGAIWIAHRGQLFRCDRDGELRAFGPWDEKLYCSFLTELPGGEVWLMASITGTIYRFPPGANEAIEDRRVVEATRVLPANGVADATGAVWSLSVERELVVVRPDGEVRCCPFGDALPVVRPARSRPLTMEISPDDELWIAWFEGVEVVPLGPLRDW